MKLIRKRLEEARRDTGLSWEIIEKDYILSWILAGIAANVKLQNELIFKGGTALKKCYFGNYRFSEDLDFTAKEDIVRGELLEKEIKKSCEIATNLVQKFSPLELKVERYVEFTNPEKFFDNILLDYIAKTWEQWLGPLVPDLPPFKLVIGDLK